MISNKEFIQEFTSDRDAPASVFSDPKKLRSSGWGLPHEFAVVEAAVGSYRKDYQAVTDEKKATGDQSGDDWHDKQFVATDEAAQNVVAISSIAQRMQRAEMVDYPEVDQAEVSLGSRVGILMHPNVSYTIDIIGYRDGHPDDLQDSHGEEIVPMSPEAIIAKSIIGLKVGETALASLNHEERVIEVTELDQAAIRQEFGGGHE